ncbi:MAG TPA: hypothetical protein VGH28_20905 [Polyangiaceae bacterium]
MSVAAGASAIAACILADPPPLQPIPQPTAPQILTASVSPPLDRKITSAPSQSLTFSVPVLANPNQPLQFRVFIDVDPNADPLAGVGLALAGTQDGGVLATGPDASTVTLVPVDFTLTSQLDYSSCHTITLVVATAFQELLPGTPVNPPGGDQATWYYEPIGDCSYFDAAPPFDASAVGDGADE